LLGIGPDEIAAVEGLENAMIMAAARDLLTACWAAEAALQTCYEITEFPADGKSDCDSALAVIRQAIRKAMSPAENI